MAAPQGSSPDFADLYRMPSVERMLTELSDKEFEYFVGYVFDQAGYGVEHTGTQYGLGLDLKLFTDPSLREIASAGVSVKQLTPPGQVNGPQVANLRGSLMRVRAGGVPGYIVTTSTLNNFAVSGLAAAPRIWPLDGDHLLRYITYVRGTRATQMQDTESDARLRRRPLAPVPPEVLLAADEIEYRPETRTCVMTVANHRGGVGKTTTALNVAFGLAAQDKQVLLVDMDPQANLTRDLPVQAPSATPAFIDDYFTGKRQLADLVRQTQFPRVWLIPSRNALTQADEGIAAGPGVELRFVRDLHAPKLAPPANLDARPFDWIIIDTGPSMGLFTRSALAASHKVLVPVAPDVFAHMGITLLKNTVGTMQALVGRPIRIVGFLITKWKENALNNSLFASFSQEVLPQGWKILDARIPLDENNITKAHLESGQNQRKTLFSHHASSKAAQGYKQAVQEIL